MLILYVHVRRRSWMERAEEISSRYFLTHLYKGAEVLILLLSLQFPPVFSGNSGSFAKAPLDPPGKEVSGKYTITRAENVCLVRKPALHKPGTKYAPLLRQMQNSKPPRLKGM